MVPALVLATGLACALAPTARAAQPGPIAAAPPATPVKAAADLPADFRESAALLDSELRRWLRDHGARRKDGNLYTMDLAPVMLYAARRGDREMYESLLPDARRLVLTAEEAGTYAQGFVLWRRVSSAPPEISGALEALWLARALYAGASAFKRPDDKALALKVMDGYARHAFELEGLWLIRKYYSLAGSSFSSMSVTNAYDGDFLDELDKDGAQGPWRTMAERSWALIERARSPAGLLYPIVQPEVAAGYPEMGLEVYAPNNLASLEQSCMGAEGAVRGAPGPAKKVLAFALDSDHRARWSGGRLYAYFDAKSGDHLGDALLSGAGYGCLAQLAAGLGNGSALKKIAPLLRYEMQQLGEKPQVAESMLYGAGPMLLGAYAAGAFNPP